MESNQTLPKLLAKRAREGKKEVALRYKYLGIWNEISWDDYYRNVEQLAISLSKDFDFKRNEKLALIGENKPAWLYSQMAAQVLGGISIGIYQESLPQQLIYYLNDCKARIVVVEGQEQVDKLLEIENEIPLVEYIIFYNDQGMRHYQHQKLIDFNEVLSMGKALLKDQADFFYEKTERALNSDTAIIAYSAATTGDPKGAMLSHENLIEAAKSIEAIDNVDRGFDYYSFLPLAWIHEQVQAITIPLLKGSVVNFPEKPNTVLSDLIEINPHVLLAPARVYQTLMSNFTTRIQDSSWFKKKVYYFFKKYANQATEAKLNNKNISFFNKLIEKVGDLLIFKPIRKHYGFTRIKRAYVAGSALESEAFYFYHSIGVNVKQTYGGTELSGIAFVHHDNDIRPESAGVPLPNTEVDVNDEGKIFVKNSAIFSKYLHKEDRDNVIDGWISLGDCGFLDDEGHLHILDRKENIIISPDEKQIYPSIIENKLKGSPYIQEAVCIGKNKPYLTAILNIDLNSVGRWADKNKVIYTAYSDLSQKDDVIKLLEKEVKNINNQLPKDITIKKFVILHKQLSPDDGELTRTFVVRRKYVTEKYNSLIEGMYRDVQEVKLTELNSENTKNRANEINLQVIHLESKKGVA